MERFLENGGVVLEDADMVGDDELMSEEEFRKNREAAKYGEAPGEE